MTSPTPTATYAYAALYGLWAVAPVLVWAAAQDLRRAVRPTWWGLAGLVGAVAIVAWAIARHAVPGVWSTNNHDFVTLASIESGAWDAPTGLGDLHGYAPPALLRALRWLTGGGVLTTDLDTALALVAVGMVGIAAAVGSGRPELGVCAALLFGLHPALLRLAPTPSPFVPFVATLAALLVSVEAWLVTGRARVLALVVVLGLLALQCRGEAFVIVPLCVVAWVVARRRRPWRETLPPAQVGLAGVATVLLLVPRLEVLRSVTSTSGVPMFATASGSAIVQNAQRIVPLGHVIQAFSLVLLAAALGWALRVDTGTRAWRLAAPAVVCGLIGLIVTQVLPPGHDPGFMSGAFVANKDRWAPLLAIHGMTDPRITDPLIVATALTGAIVAAFVAPAEGVLLGVCVVASLLPYVGVFDTFATVLRTSLVGSAMFAVAASAALVAATRLRSAVLAPPLALALAVYALGPRLAFVSYLWPMQQEYRVLRGASDPEDGTPRVVLTVEDVPTGVDVGTWDWIYRAYAPEFLGLKGVHVVSVHEALAAPEAVVGGLWVRTLGCARGVLLNPVDHPGVDYDRWLIDGRPMEFRIGWVGWGMGDDMDLDLALPCWRDPTAQTCLVQDQGACAMWTCKSYSLADTLGAPGYLDPMCRLMDETFDMTPVDVRVVADGNLSGVLGVEIDPNALVGTWRILGLRDR